MVHVLLPLDLRGCVALGLVLNLGRNLWQSRQASQHTVKRIGIENRMSAESRGDLEHQPAAYSNSVQESSSALSHGSVVIKAGKILNILLEKPS